VASSLCGSQEPWVVKKIKINKQKTLLLNLIGISEKKW
jgi:hypothetical protein